MAASSRADLLDVLAPHFTAKLRGLNCNLTRSLLPMSPAAVMRQVPLPPGLRREPHHVAQLRGRVGVRVRAVRRHHPDCQLRFPTLHQRVRGQRGAASQILRVRGAARLALYVIITAHWMQNDVPPGVMASRLAPCSTLAYSLGGRAW